jgi:hypothetical protein
MWKAGLALAPLYGTFPVDREEQTIPSPPLHDQYADTKRRHRRPNIPAEPETPQQTYGYVTAAPDPSKPAKMPSQFSIAISAPLDYTRRTHMPLSKGKSREAVSRNVKTERKHGKSQKQAVAISLNQARKSGAKTSKKQEK